MKALAALLLCGAAHAQVIECPPAFPLQNTALVGDAKTIVSKRWLSGGTAFTGEMGGNAELHGDRKDVKGGEDVQYGFDPGDPKWFVCNYGRDGAIASWRVLDAKSTSCVLQQRTRAGTTTVRMTCK